MNLIDQSISELIFEGVITPDTIEGCSDQELTAVENELRLHFPFSYRYFLSKMGKRAGMFMAGSDFTIDKLIEISQDAKALLEENEADYELSPTDIVFLTHQGYQFLFISNDKIMRYEEGEHVELVADSFDSWFANACEDEIEAFKGLN